jgi:hypothetical protein
MKISTFAPRLRASTSRRVSIAVLAALSAFGLAGTRSAEAAGARVSAALQPARITLDGAAELKLTLEGGQSAHPTLPEVPGLTFTPTSESSSYELVNGVATASESLTYQVTAVRPGNYAIPAIRFEGAGTQPLMLDVLPGQGAARGAATASSATSSGASLPPPTIGGNTTPSGTASEGQSAGQAAFVRLLVPKQQIYVGQRVPVEIKAYFRSDLGVNLDGPPTLRNDAFTTSNLSDKPAQSEESIHGVPYTVVSWFSSIVPIKSGDYSLGLELPVTLQIHQDRSAAGFPDLEALLNKGAFGASLFDDSDLQSLLGRVIEKPLLLKATPPAIDVLPLPTAGRPADFSGAVGSFEVKGAATPTHVAVGDPLTVTLSVLGEGNFDRVSSSGVPTDNEWKTYRPQASFSPQDSVGLKGSKQFEQAVVPLQAGSVRLPAEEFSYFDPQLRQYISRRTQPIVLSVDAGQGGAGNTIASTSAPAQKPLQGTNAPTSGGVQGDSIRLDTGRFVQTLRPVFLQPWFLALPGFPAAVLAGGLLFFWRRERFANDPQRADEAAHARVSALLASIDAAMRAGDVGLFMTAARTALQIRLGQWWSMKPDAVTLAEVNARLDSSWDPVRDVFRVADQVAYSGLRAEVSALEGWRQIIHDQLQRVGKS